MHDKLTTAFTLVYFKLFVKLSSHVNIGHAQDNTKQGYKDTFCLLMHIIFYLIFDFMYALSSEIDCSLCHW